MKSKYERLPPNPRIIFMGTPKFAVPTLDRLLDGGYNILGVVTQPDQPKGRGRKIQYSPVKDLAIKRELEVYQPRNASSGEFCDLIGEKRPDMAIVVAFGQILRKEFLEIPEYGVINIHASLLPSYRGAAPIQRAILDNQSTTGISIMRMNETLDTGPVLFQEEVPIHEEETAGSLHDRMSSLSGDLMVKVLGMMKERHLDERPQDESMATYAQKITRDMSPIDWTSDAITISCLIRALDPWPGACTMINGKNVKLFSPRIKDKTATDLIPGRISKDQGKTLLVETGKGVIEVKEVQYPGKKRMASSDFLRGFDLPEGIILK